VYPIKTSNMDQIYFNNNSFKIKDEEIVGLAKMVVVMILFPEMQLLVRFHANRTNKNGVWSSEREARKILRYMTDNGIDSSRLSFNGFGNEKTAPPLFTCEELSKARIHKEGIIEFIVKRE
jgi:outer membrane protein OmpA-like peptidoglycan-associated protein